MTRPQPPHGRKETSKRLSNVSFRTNHLETLKTVRTPGPPIGRLLKTGYSSFLEEKPKPDKPLFPSREGYLFSLWANCMNTRKWQKKKRLIFTILQMCSLFWTAYEVCNHSHSPLFRLKELGEVSLFRLKELGKVSLLWGGLIVQTKGAGQGEAALRPHWSD
jgi:hypothetical protein